MCGDTERSGRPPHPDTLRVGWRACPSLVPRRSVAASSCRPAPRRRRRGATRPVVTIDDAVLADPGPTVRRLHEAWARREPVVDRPRHRPGRVPRAAVVPGRAVAGGAGGRAVVRPPALPDLGQHVRRPRRRRRLVVGASRRPGSTTAPRPRPTATPTSRCPTARRRGSTAGPACRAPAGLTRRPQRLGRPRRAHRRPRTTVAPQRRPGARPAGRRRPHRRPGAGDRPGRLGQDARAHRAAAPPPPRPRLRAGAACSPSPTTSRPSWRWRPAPPTSGPGSARSTRSACGCWPSTGAGRRRCVDEPEVRRLVDSLLPGKRQRRANTDPIGPYVEGLTSIRLGLTDPDAVEASRDDVPGLAELFPAFREQLARRGAVDFDEQIYGAVEVLLADGPFRRSMQRSCRHLLVDEFQDLTPAHVLLVRLLSLPALDVFGVGDDDQCIYGHAGADPAFLIDYERLFPGAVPHPLTVNYRCPVEVVDGARTLLGYNHRRVPKQIDPGPDQRRDRRRAAHRRARPRRRRHRAGLGGRRAGWASRASTPSSVAVLARVNSLLLAPHVALHEAGVPVSSVLRPDVLERTGMRAALGLPAHRRRRRCDGPERHRRDPAPPDPRPAAVVPRPPAPPRPVVARPARRARRPGAGQGRPEGAAAGRRPAGRRRRRSRRHDRATSSRRCATTSASARR